MGSPSEHIIVSGFGAKHEGLRVVSGKLTSKNFTGSGICREFLDDDQANVVVIGKIQPRPTKVTTLDGSLST